MIKINKTYYVLEDKIQINKKSKTKNIRYLGTAKKLLADLKKLDKFREKFGKKIFKNP